VRDGDGLAAGGARAIEARPEIRRLRVIDRVERRARHLVGAEDDVPVVRVAVVGRDALSYGAGTTIALASRFTAV
jgi:hypothetical protein